MRLAAAAAAFAAAAAAAALWESIREDCRQMTRNTEISSHPLWHDPNVPPAQLWSSLKPDWSNRPGEWQFWITWYDAAFHGAPQNFDLLNEIATQPEDFWSGPDPEINARIRRVIEERGLSEYSEAAGAGRQLPFHIGDSEATDLQRQLSDLIGETQKLKRRLDENKGDTAKISSTLVHLSEVAKGVEAEAEKSRTSITKFHDDLRAEIESRFEAALSGYVQSKANEAPMTYWAEKQDEHDVRMKTAHDWFLRGLGGVAALSIGTLLLLFLGPDSFAALFSPVGCDPVNKPELCSGFSFRGMVVTASLLTLVTLLLWFTRLQMKEYLSERHLALDARERQTFAQTYVTLLALEGSSEEAKDQRALVYTSLFRPSTDGIVREDGGLDPSITAAISKLLTPK